MFDLDLSIMLVCYIQPPVLSYIIFSFTKASVFTYSWFEQLSFVKKKKKAIKFFECSAYSRLINYYQYDIHCFIFCVLFILYDVDLVFFFSESIFISSWAMLDLIVFLVYVFFFLMGFWYDYERYSFYWSF